MKRKCDRCDREATVHDVLIKDGVKHEKHLCEACAREEGISIKIHAPLSEIVKTAMIAQASGLAPAKLGLCPSCGTSFAEFRQTGLLGCPRCYSAFEGQLGGLLERAHEGGTNHVGKTPHRAGAAVDPHQRVAAIRKQLSDAIAAEQYERAARLRDQLLHSDPGLPGPIRPPLDEPR